MGKSKKSTNNKMNKPECYVLLSRKLDETDVERPNVEVRQNPIDLDVEERDVTASFNVTSFEQIRDATMESNELIKEIIYNVRLLRKEVAELTKHVKNGGNMCELRE